MSARTLSVIALGVLLLALGSCRTSEANYRAAYEKTVAGRDAEAAVDSTVYGNIRRQFRTDHIDTPQGRVEVRRQLVRVTDGGGGIPQNLRQYNVVAGQFKQLFNARSFRDRLCAAGYSGAFVVETSEPYYYIVAASFANADDAVTELNKLSSSQPVTLKSPCPFILDATARRAPAARQKR